VPAARPSRHFSNQVERVGVEDLYLAGRCRADEDPLAGAIERLAVGLGRGRDGFDDVEIQV
jgi:hypothetical protein